jgi:hypothetical protein
MKAEIKYIYNEDDDIDSKLYMVTNAESFYFSLLDLDNELRDLVKYEKAEAEGLDSETLDHVRGMIRTIMNNHGVDFDHVS